MTDERNRFLHELLNPTDSQSTVLTDFHLGFSMFAVTHSTLAKLEWGLRSGLASNSRLFPLRHRSGQLRAVEEAPEGRLEGPSGQSRGVLSKFGDAAHGMQCDGAGQSTDDLKAICQTTLNANLIGLFIPDGLQAWWCTLLVWAVEEQPPFAECVYCTRPPSRAMSLQLHSMTASPHLLGTHHRGAERTAGKGPP